MIDTSYMIKMNDRYHLNNINGNKIMVGPQKTFIWLGGYRDMTIIDFKHVMLKVKRINKQGLMTQYETYSDRQFYFYLDMEWCQAQG